MTAPSRDDQPSLFIVGCGRSGTTLVYEALARHSDSAWFSTWTDRSRRPELAAFNGVFKRGMHSRRFGPRPSEGYRIWDAQVRPTSNAGVMGRDAADLRTANRVQAVIERHRRFGRGSLFVNKNTRNTRRVLFLDALMEARFVHVLRSPLDTIASLLEVRWWDDLRLWWLDGVRPSEVSRGPLDHARLAAELWRREVAAALDATQALPPEHHREVRYEEFVRNPQAHLEMLLDWLGMPVDDRVLVDAGASPSRVGTHATRLSDAQIDDAWRVVERTAERAGYSR